MKPETLRVRWARPADAPQAFPLFQGILALEGGPAMDRRTHARMWRAQFRSGSVFRFAVAEIDGRIVGHTSLNRAYSTFGVAPMITVEDLFVEEGSRGRGAASALLAFAEAYARRIKAYRLELHVRPENRARGLYRRAGYVPTHYEWWKKPLAPPTTSSAATRSRRRR